MNGHEIDWMLRSDQVVLNYDYHGVFPVDLLPAEIDTGVYVVNTSPSTVSVGHWVVIFDRSFFCSYGIHPEIYKIYGTTSYSSTQLQSVNSSVCGLYAVAYIKARVRGFTAREFTRCFTKNHSLNDNMILDLFVP